MSIWKQDNLTQVSIMSTQENKKPGRKHRIGSPQTDDGNKTEDPINKQRKKYNIYSHENSCTN